jgi:hypothetical protein
MRNTSRVVLTAALLALGAASSLSARADTSTWTVSGTQGGQQISAMAVFTTMNGAVDVKITNTLVDPTNVIQNVSDIFFKLDSGATTDSLASSSGRERTVNNDGTYVDGAIVATGWDLDPYDNTLGHHLNVIGSAVGPEHTILGSPGAGNKYNNAGGSIAGNNAHNPFLAGTVDFVVNISGVTANSQITSVTFSFGTTNGNNSTGKKVLPEFGSVFSLGGLLMGGVAGLIIKRRVKK